MQEGHDNSFILEVSTQAKANVLNFDLLNNDGIQDFSQWKDLFIDHLPHCFFARVAFPKQPLTKGFIKATSEITTVTDGLSSAEAPLEVL